MYDPRLSLPPVPTDAIGAPGWVPLTATLIFSSISVLVFLYGLKHWRSTKQPIILMMLAGGALTSMCEPFLNVIGSCWHPVANQTVAFEFMGRPIPWWVISIYIFYFGGVGSFAYLAFEKGRATVRQLWLCFLLALVIDIFAEEMMLSTDLYIYYGPQPLVLFSKLPVWWAVCNGIGMFIGISLIKLMAPHLRGWTWLLIAPVMMISELFGYAAIALPTWTVINTDVPGWVNQLGGGLTLIMGGLVMHGIALAFGSDSPLRSRAAAKASTPQRTHASIAGNPL